MIKKGEGRRVVTELNLRGYNKYYDGGVEEIEVSDGYKNRRVHKTEVHKARAHKADVHKTDIHKTDIHKTRGIKRVKEANLFDRPPSRIKIRLNQIVIFLQNKTIFLNPS